MILLLMPESLNLTCLVSVIASFFGPVLTGISLGVSSPLKENLTKNFSKDENFNIFMISENFQILSESQFDIFSSFFGLFTFLGCFFGFLCSVHFGRRGALILAGPLWTGACLLISCGESFKILLLGRILMGIVSGMCMLNTPLYIAEISPPNFRGILGGLTSVGTNIGVLIAYYKGGYGHPIKNFNYGCDWRAMFFSFSFLGPLLFVACFNIPESPRYLAMRGKFSMAVYNLKMLREFLNEDELLALQKVPIVKDFRQNFKDLKNCKFQIILSVLIMQFKILSGIHLLTFNLNSIFDRANLKNKNFHSCFLIILCFTLSEIGSVFAEKFGRTKTFSMSFLAVSFGMFLLSLGFLFNWSSLIFFSAYFINISFVFGVGPVPYLYMSEILPDNSRSIGGALASSSQWLVSFFVTSSMGPIQKSLGESVLFFFYAVLGLLISFYSRFLFPETKGKTLEEIQTIFRRRNSFRKIKKATNEETEMTEMITF